MASSDFNDDRVLSIAYAMHIDIHVHKCAPANAASHGKIENYL